jgi:hypothetical protein
MADGWEEEDGRRRLMRSRLGGGGCRRASVIRGGSPDRVWRPQWY